jgi:hypothetical protein
MASIEKTRAVVEAGETYDGKILPTTKAEVERPVRIYEDALVEGSVYGESVTVEGGTVDGSVMASNDATLDGGAIHGEVGTDGKVVGDGVTVYGSVTGTRVRLTDAVVYGNVVGGDVVLENCAVIGIVTAERELTLEGGLCYTFKSYGETRLADASIVLPQAIVEGQIGFEGPVAVTGLGELAVADEGLPTLDETDLIEVDGSTYLSLSPRILNLQKMTDRLDELESALQRVTTASAVEDVPPPGELLETLGVDPSRYATLDRR